MIFDWLNVGSPFFWCFVGSIFLGGAVSRITRRKLGRERWTFIYLYLTVTVATTAAGLFVPGPSQFVDIRLAYFSAVCVAVGFVGFRFAVAIGVPLVLLCAVALAVLGISLRGWLPLQGELQDIGKVRVFDAGSTRVDLEVSPAAGAGVGQVSGTLPAGPLAPVVEVLRFSSYYFFVASPVLYRLSAVATSATTGTQHELPLVEAPPGTLPIATRLPGVEYKRILGTAAEPRTLQDYSVLLERSLSARLVDAPS